MKYVRTYATSANLGPGFDTLGVCFDLFNEYEYCVNPDCYKIISFDKYYNNFRHNLIIKAYEEVFKRLDKPLIYIYLKEVIRNIPTSRGLGSSASCIVCGVLIANDILGNPLSKKEIFRIATDVEGHPDNVAPLIYGGLTSCYKTTEYNKINLRISSKFKFIVCIPNYKLTTKVSRNVLPQEVSMEDAVYNISHAIATVKALESGNIKFLKDACIDKLHEPYRLDLIKESKYLKDYANLNDSVCLISGAGPTMLLISDKELTPKVKYTKCIKVNINFEGAYVYEK